MAQLKWESQALETCKVKVTLSVEGNGVWLLTISVKHFCLHALFALWAHELSFPEKVSKKYLEVEYICILSI